jgi:hypothetical protein
MSGATASLRSNDPAAAPSQWSAGAVESVTCCSGSVQNITAPPGRKRIPNRCIAPDTGEHRARVMVPTSRAALREPSRRHA